jgi:flavin reductase (DIM6/NTAB) family NADH-FMN oxidoreductase RutF
MPQSAEAEFKRVIARLTGGVLLVMSWLDGRLWGLTMSAFCSVSIAPPRVLASLTTKTVSC